MTSQLNQIGRNEQPEQATLQKPAGSRSGRGFAGMDRERQREIASLGGRAAHASGNAHQFTSEEARAAGSKRHANAAARAAAAATEGNKSAQG